MDAAGYNGQISFDGQWVTITRRGFVGRTTVGGGDKRIPVSSIGAVEWKPAGFGTRGFIHFAVAGSASARGARGARSGYQTKDEDGVVFNRHQQPAFEQIRAEIEQVMHAARAGNSPQPQPAALPDPRARLQQLEDLRQRGLISDAEYQAKRAEILGRL